VYFRNYEVAFRVTTDSVAPGRSDMRQGEATFDSKHVVAQMTEGPQ
jgi:hypothetical protein